KAVSTGQCVSYDAECVAIAMALGALTPLDDATDIHIFADNKAALASIIDTSIHSSQSLSVNACRLLRPWLATHEGNVHFHWCPGHVGLELNELVDGDVKDAAHTLPQRPYRSHAFILQGIRHDAVSTWRTYASDSAFRGRGFLTGRGPITLSDRLKTKNTMMDLAGGSNTSMARLVRATTNHAPTGEFRTKFFPHEPSRCSCTQFLYYTQTRQHILHSCSRYLRDPELHDRLRQAKDPVPLLHDFLNANPNAFSYGDA
ncbi:hypothetical protein PENSPDRAFT_540433, partial [Peniophora sp. CONT]